MREETQKPQISLDMRIHKIFSDLDVSGYTAKDEMYILGQLKGMSPDEKLGKVGSLLKKTQEEKLIEEIKNLCNEVIDEGINQISVSKSSPAGKANYIKEIYRVAEAIYKDTKDTEEWDKRKNQLDDLYKKFMSESSQKEFDKKLKSIILLSPGLALQKLDEIFNNLITPSGWAANFSPDETTKNIKILKEKYIEMVKQFFTDINVEFAAKETGGVVDYKVPSESQSDSETDERKAINNIYSQKVKNDSRKNISPVVTTKSSVWPIKITNVNKWALIPGNVHYVYEDGKLKKKHVYTVELYQIVSRNMQNLTPEQFNQALTKSKQEYNNPIRLYGCYKERASIFLEKDFPKNLPKELTADDINSLYVDFLVEVKNFVADNQKSLGAKVKADKEFTENLEKIHEKLSPELQFEVFVRTTLGDFRNGDVKADKKDRFTTEQLMKYLANKTPQQQLKILEGIFECVKNNKYQLYTYIGTFSSDTKTSTQLKHMDELKKVFYDILSKNKDKILEADLKNLFEKKEGIANYNNNILEKVGKIVKSIEDYLSEIKKDDKDKTINKATVLKTVEDIQNKDLADIVKKEVFKATGKFCSVIEEFVQQINEALNSLQVLNKENFLNIGNSCSKKSSVLAPLISAIAKHFPEEGYKNNKSTKDLEDDQSIELQNCADTVNNTFDSDPQRISLECK